MMHAEAVSVCVKYFSAAVCSCVLSERGCVMPWQVGPWCVPLPEGTRICHLRTNMGLDWGQNVVPVLPDLGALPTDILVSTAATCSIATGPQQPETCLLLCLMYRSHCPTRSPAGYRKLSSGHVYVDPQRFLLADRQFCSLDQQ